MERYSDSVENELGKKEGPRLGYTSDAASCAERIIHYAEVPFVIDPGPTTATPISAAGTSRRTLGPELFGRDDLMIGPGDPVIIYSRKKTPRRPTTRFGLIRLSSWSKAARNVMPKTMPELARLKKAERQAAGRNKEIVRAKSFRKPRCDGRSVQVDLDQSGPQSA